MSRPLVAGLLAEGDTDELFLGTVIFRQLRRLTEESSRYVVDVEPVEIGDCRTVLDHDRIADAALELARDCHLLYLHNDHREPGKAANMVARLTRSAPKVPVIPLVPVKETEAWLLADRAVWQELRGSDVAVLPAKPREVERLPDPKIVLDAVTPQRGRPRRDYFDYIGRNISLTVLKQVPAYATWLGDTEEALKGLGYL